MQGRSVALAILIACNWWGSHRNEAAAVSSHPQKSVPPVELQTPATNEDRCDSGRIQKEINPFPVMVNIGLPADKYSCNQKGSADAETSKWSDPVTLFTFALAVFACLQWSVSRRQASIMEKQGVLARAQSRAFVFLDRIETELTTAADARNSGADSLLPPNTDKGLFVTRFAIQPRWKNTGSTPTRNMEVRVSWRGAGGTLPLDFDYPYGNPNDIPQPLFLGPNAADSSDVIEISTNAPRQIINNGEPHLGETPFMFVWGRADYDDVFGVRHFIQWCYSVRFERHLGDQLCAHFIQWGGYNRSDEDGEHRPKPPPAWLIRFVRFLRFLRNAWRKTG